MNKQYLKYLIAVAVISAVGYLFVIRLINSWDSVQESVTLQFTPLSILVVIFLGSAVVVSGLMWRLVLRETNSSKVEKDIKRIEAIRVHIGAWLLKYIPGQVGSIVYKITWGAKRGYKKSNIAMSFLYENLFLTIVSLLPASVILLVFGNLDAGINVLLVAITVGSATLIFSRPIMKNFISFTANRSKIDTTKVELISTKKVIKFTGLYGLPRIMNSLGFIAVAATIMSIGAGDILPLMAAYTLAGIIGVYAIFVPSGLGLREAMIVIFAAGVIGAEQAIILSVVARFYATITDGFLAILYTTMTRKDKSIKI